MQIKLKHSLMAKIIHFPVNLQNKKPEGFMQSCTLFEQVKLHISHFLMRSMGAAILEKLSLILRNSL